MISKGTINIKPRMEALKSDKVVLKTNILYQPNVFPESIEKGKSCFVIPVNKIWFLVKFSRNEEKRVRKSGTLEINAQHENLGNQKQFLVDKKSCHTLDVVFFNLTKIRYPISIYI